MAASLFNIRGRCKVTLPGLALGGVIVLLSLQRKKRALERELNSAAGEDGQDEFILRSNVVVEGLLRDLGLRDDSRPARIAID